MIFEARQEPSKNLAVENFRPYSNKICISANNTLSDLISLHSLHNAHYLSKAELMVGSVVSISKTKPPIKQLVMTFIERTMHFNSGFQLQCSVYVLVTHNHNFYLIFQSIAD